MVTKLNNELIEVKQLQQVGPRTLMKSYHF